MTDDLDLKRQVREFYDAVGWQLIDEGLYQNAGYEDLRPVSQEYIQRCHRRVGRHLPLHGKLILDAGSGPIQYPEYLEYSRGFRYRVCLDVSRQALNEARRRIGGHGLYVAADIANLPFPANTFEGVVSLHTVHHLPEGEHRLAFEELCRVLATQGKGVVVYSWGQRSPLMRLMSGPIALSRAVQALWSRARSGHSGRTAMGELSDSATWTYTFKHDYPWVMANLRDLPGFDLLVWRSVSTSFLRAFIFRRLLGRGLLDLLYRLEELAPGLFGRVGQYPMILFSKTD